MDRRDFLARVRNLNVWSSGGQRAPNKPLLLLLALGRLQRGDGLWDVPGADSVPTSRSGDFHTTVLTRRGIEGGLSEACHRLLLGNAELVAEAAQLLLQGHFPESLHDDIRDAVGLRAEWVARDAQAPARDPGFRSAVLRAYERRCAVCDYDIGLGDDLLGLEAAHIRWHAAGGPDEVNNGLALCGFHHARWHHRQVFRPPALTTG